jgi:hypothetical protein
MITGLRKSQKNGNQTSPDHQNVDAKVGHQHYRETGTLNKIQDYKKKKKKREILHYNIACYAHRC